MLNRVILIGRLTHDPELRMTTNSANPDTGLALASFSLAVDRPFQSGRQQKETDFIRIICWGKLAERCKQYLAKGRLVAVEGRLQIRNWDTPNGERRTIAEVRADDVRFLDRGTQGAEHHSGGGIPPIGEDEYDPAPPPDDREFRPPAQPQKRQDFGNKAKESDIDLEIDLDSDDPFSKES